MKTSWEKQSESINKGLGRRIRQLRNQKGLTQGELAEMLSTRTGKQYKIATVSRLEAGNRPTPLPEVLLLAELFEVSVATLLPPEGIDELILIPISFQLAAKEATVEAASAKLDLARNELEHAQEALQAAQLLVDSQKRLMTPTKSEFAEAALSFIWFSAKYREIFKPFFLLEVFDVPEDRAEEIANSYLEMIEDIDTNSDDPFSGFEEAQVLFAVALADEVYKVWGAK